MPLLRHMDTKQQVSQGFGVYSLTVILPKLVILLLLSLIAKITNDISQALIHMP